VLSSIEYLSSLPIPSSLTASTDSIGQPKFAGCSVNTEQAANADRKITSRILTNIIYPPLNYLLDAKLKKIFLNVFL
jgi:hypothetical protein